MDCCTIFQYKFKQPTVRCVVVRHSVVDTANRYGLDGPWIESRWGPDLPHPYRLALGPGLFPGVKRPRRGVDRPPPSSAEVKEIVVKYLYSQTLPSWQAIGWTSPFTAHCVSWLHEWGEFLNYPKNFPHIVKPQGTLLVPEANQMNWAQALPFLSLS